MGIYRVTVETEFSASHQLRMYDGQLEPMHGHVWLVRATFAGDQLDDIDVLIDFVEVKRLCEEAVHGWHSRHLNDLPCFDQTNPTAENVARSVFESLSTQLETPELLERVAVREAPDCWASYGVNSGDT